MVLLLRTSVFLLFGLVAAFWDLRTFRIPRWCSFGGTALLLCLGDPLPQLRELAWPLVILGPLRLASPKSLGGGDIALSLLLAAYLGGAGWSEALLLASLLLLLLDRLGPVGRRGLSLESRRYPFAPFLVFASVARGSLGPLRDSVALLFALCLLTLPITPLAPQQRDQDGATANPGVAGAPSDALRGGVTEEPVIVEMEFREQPIREILLVLASATGRSIVPDPTVTGRASYFFSQIPLEAALESFCEAQGLYLLPRPRGVTLVSRIRVRVEEADTSFGSSAVHGQRSTVRYSVDVTNAPLTTLLQRISLASGTPIRQVGLEQEEVSFHGGPLELDELLRAIVAGIPGTLLERGESHLLLRRVETAKQGHDGWGEVDERALYGDPLLLEEGEGRYTLSVEDASLQELLEVIFGKHGGSYLLRGGGDRRVGGISLRNRSFSEILEAVLQQAGVEAAEQRGYTEIRPLSGPDAMPVEISIPLRRWAPEEIVRLLPGDLLSRLHPLPDGGTSRLLLSGEPEAVARGALLVSAVDRGELGATPYEALQLSHAGARAVLAALPERFGAFTAVASPDDRWLIVAMPPGALTELRRFVELFDRPMSPRYYPLAALRGEEFVERFAGGPGMPEVRTAPGGRGLLAWGSEGEIANLEGMLLSMDRPARQIRYDLLILQRQHREGHSYDLTAEIDNSATGGAVALGGVFDQLLTLRFDAIAVLGYRLAAAISRGLSERSARLLADTTLYGLDGAEVSFNNTQTYRYRDLAYDENEKEVLPTGITREISSGITLSVVGEVVEEQQVRMRISAEYSKQGVELSGSDDPPPTSEKRVETTVRTEAGKPIILAGLLQREREEERRPVPILSRIPLLRYLFRPGRRDEEVTELVIYLVPHIERSGTVGFPGTVDELLGSLLSGGTR